MMNKDEKYFKDLARNLMFELTDEEATDIKHEFTTLLKQIELLEKINTEGVLPMVYPFEEDTFYIRDDEVSKVISKEDALKNVKVKKEGYVVVPKVVK